jgi:methionyl-tRNA synthetase
MIIFEDFQKLEIKIGEILEAEAVPEADRLLKFKVDLGEGDIRIIISGVREHYPDPAVLIGRQVPVLVNLAPRMIKGIESQGMILYAVGEGENFTTLEPSKKIPPGTIVR